MPKQVKLQFSAVSPVSSCQHQHSIKIRHQLSHYIYTTEEDKGALLLSFPMGGSCGSCRPLRPDMGVLVGLVCTDPLRGCALHDRKSDGHSGEKQVRAPPDGGCGAWPCCTHITV